MTDDIVTRVIVQTSEALAAVSAYGKANDKLATQMALTAKAQASFDAALAAGGASTDKAVAAQARLDAALKKTAYAEQQVAIAAAKSAEVQAAASLKASAAAEKATVARKASAASAVSSLTGFSAQTSGVLAVGAAFLYATKQAADFDAKMAQLRSLAKDATVGQLAASREAAFGYAELGISATDAADAQIELTKAGIGVKDQLGGALTGTLNLAAAGMTDVGTATEIAAAAMTAFQLQGKDVPHIADLLAAGADKALGSVTDLGEGLKYAALPAHQLGLSVDETVAALAEFAQAGLKGSQGGTALQMMLQRLIKPTAEAKVLMDKYGISLYDAQGGFVGLSNLAGQLHDKLKPLSLETRQTALATIFSARAARGAAILYQDGAEGVQEWSRNVNDAGFAADQAKGKMDSLSGDLSKLKASFQNLATSQGEAAQGPFRQTAQGVTSLVDLLGSGPVQSALVRLDALANPFTKGVSAFNKLSDFVGGANDPAPATWDPFGDISAQAGAGISDALNRAANASRAMGGAMSDTADSVGSFAGEVGHAQGEVAGLGFSIKELTGAMKANMGVLDHRAAMRDYADAIKAVNEAQKHNKTTTTEMNEALDSQAKAAINAASTMVAGSKQQITYLNSARDALYEQARQFGMTRDEADTYVNSVLRIPGEANTHVNLYASEAQRRINALLAAYNQLKSKTVTVTANIQQSAGFTAGGHTVFEYAEGGRIRGTGTGTSDSNVIRASRDEFMVKERSAKSIGYGNLAYMNRTGRLPGFAQGGRLGGWSGGGGSGQTVIVQQSAFPGKVTLNLDAKAFKQIIRGESQVVVTANAEWASR